MRRERHTYWRGLTLGEIALALVVVLAVVVVLYHGPSRVWNALWKVPNNIVANMASDGEAIRDKAAVDTKKELDSLKDEVARLKANSDSPPASKPAGKKHPSKKDAGKSASPGRFVAFSRTPAASKAELLDRLKTGEGFDISLDALHAQLRSVIVRRTGIESEVLAGGKLIEYLEQHAEVVTEPFQRGEVKVDALVRGTNDKVESFTRNSYTSEKYLAVRVGDRLYRVISLWCINTINDHTGIPVRRPTPATQAPPRVSATLTANPMRVQQGGSTVLQYACTNATSATASGHWGGDKSPQGGIETIFDLRGANKSFTLTCIGPGGTANAIVTVEVEAKVSEAPRTEPTVVETITYIRRDRPVRRYVRDFYDYGEPSYYVERYPRYIDGGGNLTLTIVGGSRRTVNITNPTPGTPSPTVVPTNVTRTRPIGGGGASNITRTR